MDSTNNPEMNVSKKLKVSRVLNDIPEKGFIALECQERIPEKEDKQKAVVVLQVRLLTFILRWGSHNEHVTWPAFT